MEVFKQVRIRKRLKKHPAHKTTVMILDYTEGNKVSKF